MNGRTKVSIAVLLALLSLAACNSGSSREEFVADATQICEDAQTSLEDLSGGDIANADPSEITQTASEQLSNLRDELGDLAPPDDLSDDFDSMLEGLDAAIEDVDALSAAVDEVQGAGADGAEEALQEVQATTDSLADNLDQASKAARDMGLEGCGEATGS